jgi:ABC-2 type transport system permease protein
VFALFIVSSALVTLVTLAVATRRDVGAGLWSRHRDGASSTRLLGSTTQVATREELPTLIVWVISAGTFALLLGAFSKTIAEDAARSDLNHALGTAVTTATGYLSLSFVLFSLVVTLFAATHILGMNGEESSGRLETLFALPVSRTSWMVGRLALAVCSSIALGLLIGVLAWVGAAGRDAGVSLGSLIAAGANTVPAALLFIGVGALLFGVAPRHAGGITMTLVGAAFLWQLVGAALGVPAWVLTVSPFAHVAAVPEGAFDSQGAVAMILIGAVALAAGVIEFGRRDLQEG